MVGGMNGLETLIENVPKIEELLGYTFSDKELLFLAFTHRSFFNENRERVSGHNERLEFLGDSVLGLIVSGYLYNHLPSRSEGHLSHLRSHLVGAESCSLYTKKLGIEGFLMLGKGEAANVGRGRERLLADLFEAIIGAMYLDGGWQASEVFFFRHFSDEVEQAMAEPLRNWKAELQNYGQKKTQRPPEYQIIEEVGPPHSKTFVIAAVIDGVEIGRGEGASKKLAEQAAAEDALRHIEKEEVPDGEG